MDKVRGTKEVGQVVKGTKVVEPEEEEVNKVQELVEVANNNNKRNNNRHMHSLATPKTPSFTCQEED